MNRFLVIGCLIGCSLFSSGVRGDENLMLPEVVGADYELAGTNVTLYGWVIDDGPVGNLLVMIGGNFGEFLAVTDEDGGFTFSISQAPDTTWPAGGDVTIFAIDDMGYGGPVVHITAH